MTPIESMVFKIAETGIDGLRQAEERCNHIIANSSDVNTCSKAEEIKSDIARYLDGHKAMPEAKRETLHKFAAYGKRKLEEERMIKNSN